MSTTQLSAVQTALDNPLGAAVVMNSQGEAEMVTDRYEAAMELVRTVGDGSQFGVIYFSQPPTMRSRVESLPGYREGMEAVRHTLDELEITVLMDHQGFMSHNPDLVTHCVLVHVYDRRIPELHDTFWSYRAPERYGVHPVAQYNPPAQKVAKHMEEISENRKDRYCLHQHAHDLLGASALHSHCRMASIRSVAGYLRGQYGGFSYRQSVNNWAEMLEACSPYWTDRQTRRRIVAAKLLRSGIDVNELVETVDALVD